MTRQCLGTRATHVQCASDGCWGGPRSRRPAGDSRSTVPMLHLKSRPPSAPSGNQHLQD